MADLGGYPIYPCLNFDELDKVKHRTIFALQRNDQFAIVDIVDDLVRQLREERETSAKDGGKPGELNRYLVCAIAVQELADHNMNWAAMERALRDLEVIPAKNRRDAMKNWFPVQWRSAKPILREYRDHIEACAARRKKIRDEQRLAEQRIENKRRLAELREKHPFYEQAVLDFAKEYPDDVVLDKLHLTTPEKIEFVKLLLEANHEEFMP